MSSKCFFAFFLLGMLSVLISCKEEMSVPDVSGISTDGKFDHGFLFIFDPNGQVKIQATLTGANKTFLDLYLHQVIFPRDTSVTDENAAAKLAAIASDPIMKGLSDTLHLAFDEQLTDLNTAFQNSLKYLKHYFPEYPTPNIYLCNTLFNYQKFIFQDVDGKDGIALGGEMFLNDYIDYKGLDPTNPAYSDYLTRTFNREHLVKKAMDLVVDELAGPPSGGRLLDYMIQNGKKLYVLQHLLPYAPDSIIFEYTPEQVAWCQENELEMWGFFLEEKLFFESSPLKIAKFISDSPNSPGMPLEAPGKTANYLGLQIIKKYVENTPGMDLQQLLKQNNSQEILDKSRYKPKAKQ